MRPPAGRGGPIRVLGVDPVREHRRLTDSVGYLSQRFSLYADLSVDENIAFFAEIHGVRDHAARRDRLLAITQLAPFRARLAGKLSGGMKQKLALACTLIHEPALIVLDEPTTGVDPVSRREFWKLLSEFLEQGITILMATPYLDEAERCSRVALLHEGRLLALDTPAALRATLSGVLLEVIADDHRRAADVLRTLSDVSSVEMFGERAHVRLVKSRRQGRGADRFGAAVRPGSPSRACARSRRPSKMCSSPGSARPGHERCPRCGASADRVARGRRGAARPDGGRFAHAR